MTFPKKSIIQSKLKETGKVSSQLDGNAMSFCLQTGMFWPVYIEGWGWEGEDFIDFYVKRDVTFTAQPCVGIKEQSFRMQCTPKSSIKSAFYAMYWLEKHCIANKQANSLIMLLEHLSCEVKAFQHKSPGLVREIIQLIAKTIQVEIVDQVKPSATFGIFADDMTDITSKEQIIIFMQYQYRTEEKVKQSFSQWGVYLNRVKAVVPNAETLFQVLLWQTK